ncbi:ParB N-terminal domain-containing protein [Jiella pacifica]|uniref:ParB N-terminal domain-containing protein n=1 Tax=Jiella pacifica TaxID=2696469 RepID=A0A6N9T965_9HYPH|nr:ParB N-terminal domain-containing protein [Jiella pacifica]NDW07984.1 ParB N-terminal domain-containing protein [Jiella pacifica]
MVTGSSPVTATLRLDKLVRDEQFRMRSKLNLEHVQSYEDSYRAGETVPLVIVAQVGGIFILVDGWHRIEALERLDVREIEAKIYKTTRDVALWMAGMAALKQGTPLSSRELRKVFRAYVEAGKHVLPEGKIKSYREMSADLGKPIGTIHAWMRKDFPIVAASISDVASGKLQDGPSGRAHQHSHLTSARKSLQQLHSSFQAMIDADDRRVIIEELEKALSAMRECRR